MNRKIRLGFLIVILVLFSEIIKAQTIEFTKKTGNNNPLNGVDVGTGLQSHSIDIDNDGDFDLFVGNGSGTILYYKNIGTVENPNVFEVQTGVNNPLNGVDVGENSIPVFVDMDKDLDFDLFIGSKNSIHYYKNMGTQTAPVFTLQTGVNNPLNAVISSGDRAYLPSFVDIDSDSDFDVFIGFIDYDVADSSGILYYENKGTSLVANFQQQIGANNPFVSFNELYPQPIFVDIDSDNDMDVFIGKGNGTFDYYENTTELLGLKVNNTFLKATKMYPNPATTELTFESFEKDVEIRIFSLSGIQVYKGIISEKNDKIDVSAIPSGIYVVVLNDGMTKISKKLVIAK